MREASLLYTVVAMVPIPPAAEKTSGENALCLSLPQKLCATMSGLALSSLLAVLCSNCSLVTGCKLGSIPTQWQTSLRRSAVMLQISLCQMVRNPPLGQLNACSMVKCWSQTQWDGRCTG